MGKNCIVFPLALFISKGADCIVKMELLRWRNVTFVTFNYRWLKDQFKEADKDNNGSLNFDECCTLLKQLNIKMDKSHAKKLFNVSSDRVFFHWLKLTWESIFFSYAERIWYLRYQLIREIRFC